MGFGGLLHFAITDIPSRLAYWLLSRFDPIQCSIKLAHGQHLHISEEDVHVTFGFPRGSQMMERKTRQENLKVLDDLAADGGKGRYMMLPKYIKEQMEKDPSGGELFKRCFLILMEHAVIEGTADGYVKPKILDYINSTADVGKYNWCAYLIDVLAHTYDHWKDKPSTIYTGPIAFVMAFYADRVVHRRRTVVRSYSTIRGWSRDMLKRRQAEELKYGGFGRGCIEPRFDVHSLPSVSGMDRSEGDRE